MIRGALAAAALLAPAPASDPLADAAGLFGARLGMTRAEVKARMPNGCVEEYGGADLFLGCDARKLSAGFTAAGRAWWLTASFDLTGTGLTLAEAQAALLVRFGKAVEVDRTLIWLPSGSRADAARCLGRVTLLTAQVELRGGGGAAELTPVEAGCLPLRSAILAERPGHHGLVVQEEDPRARIAGLAK